MREASHIWSPLDSVGKLKKVRRIRPYTAYGPPGPESVAFFRDALPDEVGRSKPGGAPAYPYGNKQRLV
jgi:hypothetical protein